MADELDPRDEAALAVNARHALHDEELVAALATGSLEEDGERARAATMVERCPTCRALHADLAAIGQAIRAEAAFPEPAPRDFRLTAEDARRLGGNVVVRGVRAAFAGWLVSVARPLGASFATLGIGGLLVGSLVLGGGGASFGLGAPAAGPASTAWFEEHAGRPKDPTSTDSVALGPAGTRAPGPNEAVNQDKRDAAEAGFPAATLLLLASLTLLVVGGGLLWIGFRRGRSPAART